MYVAQVLLVVAAFLAHEVELPKLLDDHHHHDAVPVYHAHEERID